MRFFFVVGSCKVDIPYIPFKGNMADNETFRFLGGLALANLFSVHVRIGACLGVLSGAKTGGLGAILAVRGNLLANFGGQKRHLKNH